MESPSQTLAVNSHAQKAILMTRNCARNPRSLPRSVSTARDEESEQKTTFVHEVLDLYRDLYRRPEMPTNPARKTRQQEKSSQANNPQMGPRGEARYGGLDHLGGASTGIYADSEQKLPQADEPQPTEPKNQLYVC